MLCGAQRCALPRQSEENENIHLNKYFISSTEDRIHDQSQLLHHDWPQNINKLLIISKWKLNL